jgi:hypothetical protein
MQDIKASRACIIDVALLVESMYKHVKP